MGDFFKNKYPQPLWGGFKPPDLKKLKKQILHSG